MAGEDRRKKGEGQCFFPDMVLKGPTVSKRCMVSQSPGRTVA